MTMTVAEFAKYLLENFDHEAPVLTRDHHTDKLYPVNQDHGIAEVWVEEDIEDGTWWDVTDEERDRDQPGVVIS